MRIQRRLRPPTFQPVEALVVGLRDAGEARDIHPVAIAHVWIVDQEEFVDVRSLRCDPIGEFANLAIMRCDRLNLFRLQNSKLNY
jgi:hypothetical protein